MKHKRFNLAMTNVVEYEDFEWFLTLNHYLCRIEKNSKNLKVIKRIPIEKILGKIFIHNGKIYLLPWHSSPIVVYDIEKDDISYIEYDKMPYYGMVFWGGIEYGGYLYVIPCAYDRVLKINLSDYKVEYIKISLDIKNSMYAWGNIYEKDGYVYFTTLEDNKILRLNCNTDQVELYLESNNLTSGGAGILGCDEYLWIMPKSLNYIIQYDMRKHVENIINCDIEGYHEGEWSFHEMLMYDKRIYFSPRCSNMGLIFDTVTKRFKEWGDFKKRQDGEFASYMPISALWISNNILYAAYSETGVIFDITNMVLEEYVSSADFSPGAFEENTMEEDENIRTLRNYLRYINETL